MKTLFKILLTEEQVNNFVKNVEAECGCPIEYNFRIEETSVGIVDKPALFAKICSASGTYMTCKMNNIRSDKKRIDEFYSKHARRLGIGPKSEWFVRAYK